jgi:hypothetical protein
MTELDSASTARQVAGTPLGANRNGVACVERNKPSAMVRK